MLQLPDSWVWDFWFADDGETYHVFFLYSSRALHDPGRRHMRASIGHAVSSDLIRWERVPDALVRGDSPAFDDVATWTGSVVRAPDGIWHMFYTGVSELDGALIQRVGLATSADLVTWHKNGSSPVVSADSRWYERFGDSTWPDEAWRDPWVFADPDGDGWHMLITARASHGPVDDRGVVGHARSRDLLTWQVQPPLSQPGAGFGQLEVLQTEVIDGRTVMLFSCLKGELSASRKAAGSTGGVWTVSAASPLGPFDIASAVQLTDDSMYVGRLIKDRAQRWVMLAFHNNGPTGRFVGALSDPIPVVMTGKGLTIETRERQRPTSLSTP
jgi:beta-fructofuranosidase